MDSVVSGKVIGTGAELDVVVGFKPARVELMISESSIKGFWDNSMRDAVFLIEYCAELRTGEILLGSHLPLIGTTDTQIANTRCVTQHDAAGDVRVEVAAVAAGTAFAGAADDITADKWGCYKVCAASGGAISITPDTSLANDTEAEAIANMGATPANEAVLGYVTVKATAGAVFDATTDALAGGTSGTPAEKTNYYAGYGVMSNGITVYGGGTDTFRGFRIGTNAGLNILGSEIFYKAYRS